MPLQTGKKMGPYEIVAPIGAGGMGEVYRARDTRLDRTVAVKVLPGHLSAYGEVRQRFEREAKAVSGLNHPNICTLYDIGNEDGVDFLVMEYLEGESLADRLERGPLETDEAIAAAAQIADALDRAHRSGFIHRDLKPGNIMMTPSGAKLLDFGLARPAPVSTSETDLTQSPTVSKPLTAEGTIVGTFHYMAPEQIEAGEADARTDIFAFGCVVYEMATGQRAFAGNTQASLIASILKEDPRPIAELMPMTPPALDRLVRRCLSKHPDDRWQTARDIKLELDWVRAAGSQAGVPAPVKARRESRSRLAWALAAVFGVAAVAMGVGQLMKTTERPRVMRFSVLPPPHQRPDVSQAQLKVSPDGAKIVFAATDSSGILQLWYRRLDSRTATPVGGSRNSMALPFWSPDSRSVAFFSSEGKLVRANVPEGSPQVVCDAPDGRGGTWGSEDIIVFQPASAGPLYKVPANGGAVEQVTVLDSSLAEDAHRWPEFLPDGRHFIYVALPMTSGAFRAYVGSIDGDLRKPVLESTGAPVYAEPGYILFARNSSIFAQPFDSDRLELTGAPMPLGEDAGTASGWTGGPELSVSMNGVLVHGVGGWIKHRLTWLDRSGKEIGRLNVADGVYTDAALSPDGRRVAYVSWRIGTGPLVSDIWTLELDRDVATRFTFDSSQNLRPKWSPDGKRIAFTSNREGTENLHIKPLDGSREAEILYKSKDLFTKAGEWSPDGGYLLYHTLGKAGGFDLWALPMDGESKPIPLVVTPFNELDGMWSPDGKVIAFRSDESGRFELYVQSFPSGAGKYRVSTSGAGNYGEGFILGFRDDGRELLYVGGDNVTVMAVELETDGEFRAGIPKPLFRIEGAPQLAVGMDMTPDAQRFLYAKELFEQSAFSVVVNWPEILER